MAKQRAGGRARVDSGLASGEEHVRHRQEHIQNFNDKTYGFQQLNEGLCNSCNSPLSVFPAGWRHSHLPSLGGMVHMDCMEF